MLRSNGHLEHSKWLLLLLFCVFGFFKSIFLQLFVCHAYYTGLLVCVCASVYIQSHVQTVCLYVIWLVCVFLMSLPDLAVSN